MALGGNKRRMPDNPTPDMLKRMRTEEQSGSANGSSHSLASSKDIKGKGRAPTVKTEEEEEEEFQREDASFAPGGDADYFAEEDEEGRFFGGGLTDEQKTILNIFDNAAVGDRAQDVEDLGITGIRKLLLKFERAINKNQAQRSKYPDDPSKFIDSEADLDAAIKSLLPLAQSPVLAYSELVRSGTVAQLVGLLSHENVDIVIDVIEVIQELTDEDVGNEGEGDEDEDEQLEGSKEAAMKILIDGLLENSILELLVSNLSRLNEAEESDRQGVFHTLGIFENVIGLNPDLARTLISTTSILKWLLERVQSKNHDENRGYASEMIAIVLQNNRENRLTIGKQGGVDIILQVLSHYRKRDPVDADEAEFMENLFDALCSALSEPENKKLFLDGEGVELMVIMMKEKMLARSRSIKVLDHAMSGSAGSPNCERFVETLGLKTLFSAFMGKASKPKKNSLATTATEDTGHILGIIASLFSNLASESTARVRLLAKFVESEYEKVDKLLELRESAEARLAVAVKGIEKEKKEMLDGGEEVGPEEEDVWYLRKLDNGLYTLQIVDYILGWVSMEDDGVRSHIQLMMGRRGKGLRDIVKVLKEYQENVTEEDEQKQPDDGMIVDDQEGVAPSQKQILGGLIAFLESV
ncbi:hypothetical protein FRC02_001962 [Tulasnella sp. 418]|nr:hypothetical protein FRC02_001962 [Tulasnella sp. 418]